MKRARGIAVGVIGFLLITATIASVINWYAPKMITTHATQQIYSSMDAITKDSTCIVTGYVLSREPQPFLGGKSNETVVDAISESQFVIRQVWKQDTQQSLQAGDKILVYEPAGIVNKAGRRTYYSTNGYQLMKKKREYVLFLSSGKNTGEYVINGFQGKCNLDGMDEAESQFMKTEQKALYQLIRDQALLKYGNRK